MNDITTAGPSSDGRQPTHDSYPTWEHVIPLPTQELMGIVGARSVEKFLVVGDAWGQLVTWYAPDHATVLEIGCGCGRAARVLVNNRWISRYIGFDVIRRSIEWCRCHIAPYWHGTAEFHWFDLYSGEYNPLGGIHARQFTFPCKDGAADIVFAASVFTHLLEPDAVRYLEETRRVLSTRGTALLSIHIEFPAGERFHGTEARIDMDPKYFVELATRAGLRHHEDIDFAGQQTFAFKKS